MSKVARIVVEVDRKSPGLLDSLSKDDGVSKEELVRKVLSISRGKVVRTHRRGEPARNKPFDMRITG